MPILMIPSQLWRRLDVADHPEAQADDSIGKLGNWSVASMATAYGDLALFVNQPTRLAIVTPLVPISTPAFADQALALLLGDRH